MGGGSSTASQPPPDKSPAAKPVEETIKKEKEDEDKKQSGIRQLQQLQELQHTLDRVVQLKKRQYGQEDAVCDQCKTRNANQGKSMCQTCYDEYRKILTLPGSSSHSLSSPSSSSPPQVSSPSSSPPASPTAAASSPSPSSSRSFSTNSNVCPLCQKQRCSPQLSTCSDCAVKDLQQALQRQEKEFKRQQEEQRKHQEEEFKFQQEEVKRQQEEIKRKEEEIKRQQEEAVQGNQRQKEELAKDLERQKKELAVAESVMKMHLNRQHQEFKHQEEQFKRQEEEFKRQKEEFTQQSPPSPSYWKTSLDDPNHVTFVPVPSSSALFQNIADSFEKTKLVKPLGTLNAGKVQGGPDCPKLLHDSFQIGNVWHIENPDCWKKYAAERETVQKNIQNSKVLQSKFVPLNPALRTLQHEHSFVEAQESGVLEWAEKALELNSSANETLLFHGLKDEKTARTVAREGFDPRASYLRNVFGSGLYGSDRSSKAEEYCEQNSSGSCFLLLARVTLGVMHVQHTWLTSPSKQLSDKIVRRPFCVEGHNLALQGHKQQLCGHELTHSTLGMPTRKVGQLYREFVVYEKNQLYPEFMVEFKRVTKKSQQQQQQQQQQWK